MTQGAKWDQVWCDRLILSVSLWGVPYSIIFVQALWEKCRFWCMSHHSIYPVDSLVNRIDAEHTAIESWGTKEKFEAKFRSIAPRSLRTFGGTLIRAHSERPKMTQKIAENDISQVKMGTCDNYIRIEIFLTNINTQNLTNVLVKVIQGHLMTSLQMAGMMTSSKLD